MLLDISKQRRIEGLLLAAWNDAKERMRSPLVGQKMTSYTFTLKDSTLGFIIGIKGMSSMNEIMELILSEELIGRRFSPKYLRRQLDELLSDLVKADPKGIQKQTSTSISKLVQQLISIPSRSWMVGIPIINLELKEPSFKLGAVIFANYNSDIGKSLIKTFSEILQTSQTTDEVKKFTISKVTENYENCVIAIIDVNAVDGEEAIMIGATEIELALYVILFYGRAVISNDIISYRMYIGTPGHIFRGQSVALTVIEPTSNVQENLTKINFANTGYLYPYVIDQESIVNMNRLYLQKTSNILDKSHEERTDFEKLIITAIRFYGMAMNEYDQRSSFINFITCLESVLLKEREPQKGVLAERVAIIIRDDINDRKETFEKMERLYKLRSDYLHRGTDKITRADVSLISYYAFEVVIKLISYSEVVNDIGKLIEKINRSKFGGPTF